VKSFLSIASQILLAVIVTVVIVLGISSVVELYILKHREIQQLQQRGTVTADRISNSLAYPLWNLSQPETERIVLDELVVKEVAGIQVFDEQGQLYVGKYKSVDGSIHDSNTNGPVAEATDYTYQREVRFKNYRIGSVKLDVSSVYLQPELTKLQWGIAIRLLLLVVVLSFVLSTALRVLVVRRLSLLKSWVEGPRKNDEPPHFKYSTEINSLADAFGNLSIHLRNKHEELEREHTKLRELNKELRQEVGEREQAQEELRKYADRISDLYNNAPCGYHSLDEDGVYVQVNDTELSWLGRTREEVIGRLHFSEMLAPGQSAFFEERFRKFVTEGSIRDVEYQLVSKDGTTRTILLGATSVTNSEGQFVMSRATLYDITDRRRAEELVERSEEKFARAFRSSPVGLAVSRLRDGRFIEVNEAAASFLGFTLEQLIGETTLNLELWPDLAERNRLIAMLSQHGSVRDQEVSFRTKQGTERLCSFSAEPIEVDGEPCVLVVLLDLTERRYMEKALKANEEVLRLFVRHSPAAIAMFDNDMRYLQVSDRFLTDYHLEGQEVIGKCHYDLFPYLPEHWKEVHRRILAGAVERNDEDPYIDNDGNPGWLQWESRPWRKPDGEIGGLILFTQVITERKRAETELRASEDRLRALSAKMQSAREEEGTRIAREIHDELGGSLTGLKWDLESIETKLLGANGNSTIADIRKQIGAISGRIESTINTVRRISSELRPGVLDDLGLVAAIEWQAQQFQKRTGLKVHWESELDTVEVSREAATAVFRIFQEVLTNVLRHSEASNIHVRLLQHRHHLELKVVDDGRGITEAEKQNTESLGLLGMKERALLVGGEVSITGSSEKGTTVVVTVPLSRESESQAIA
jgi:PAS domain S-box-containing protein